MKDKQKRKKERTWAEAARMVLENFSDAPMTPKQILHVIQTKGLKEMRSGTAPLACLVTMLHSQVRGDRVKNSIFFKLPGRMSLFTLKKNALQWTKSSTEAETADTATQATASTATAGPTEGGEQESCDSMETIAASGENDASVDESSSSASCSTEPQTRLSRSGVSGQVRSEAQAQTRLSRSRQSGRQRKKAVMMPRVVLTPLKVNGDHVPSGPMKRSRGGVEVDFETPGSILVNTNIRALINMRTFSAFPAQYQQQLLQLLPEVDRQVGPDGLARLSNSALNNEFFTHASQSWKERLAEGEFTHEMQVRFRQEMEKEKKVEAWKEKFFEEYHGQKSGLTREESLKLMMSEEADAAASVLESEVASVAAGTPKRRGVGRRRRDGRMRRRTRADLRRRARRTLCKTNSPAMQTPEQPEGTLTLDAVASVSAPSPVPEATMVQGEVVLQAESGLETAAQSASLEPTPCPSPAPPLLSVTVPEPTPTPSPASISATDEPEVTARLLPEEPAPAIASTSSPSSSSSSSSSSSPSSSPSSTSERQGAFTAGLDSSSSSSSSTAAATADPLDDGASVVTSVTGGTATSSQESSPAASPAPTPTAATSTQAKEQKRRPDETQAFSSFPEKRPRIEDRQSFRTTIDGVHTEKPQPTAEEPKVPPIRIQLSRIKPPWVKGPPTYQICPRIVPASEGLRRTGTGARTLADIKARAQQARAQREAAAAVAATGDGPGPGGGRAGSGLPDRSSGRRTREHPGPVEPGGGGGAGGVEEQGSPAGSHSPGTQLQLSNVEPSSTPTPHTAASSPSLSTSSNPSLSSSEPPQTPTPPLPTQEERLGELSGEEGATLTPPPVKGTTNGLLDKAALLKPESVSSHLQGQSEGADCDRTMTQSGPLAPTSIPDSLPRFGAQGVDVIRSLAGTEQVRGGGGGVIQHGSHHVGPQENPPTPAREGRIQGERQQSEPPGRERETASLPHLPPSVREDDAGHHSDSTETASDCENESQEEEPHLSTWRHHLPAQCNGNIQHLQRLSQKAHGQPVICSPPSQQNQQPVIQAHVSNQHGHSQTVIQPCFPNGLPSQSLMQPGQKPQQPGRTPHPDQQAIAAPHPKAQRGHKTDPMEDYKASSRCLADEDCRLGLNPSPTASCKRLPSSARPVSTVEANNPLVTQLLQGSLPLEKVLPQTHSASKLEINRLPEGLQSTPQSQLSRQQQTRNPGTRFRGPTESGTMELLLPELSSQNQQKSPAGRGGSPGAGRSFASSPPGTAPSRMACLLEEASSRATAMQQYLSQQPAGAVPPGAVPVITSLSSSSSSSRRNSQESAVIRESPERHHNFTQPRATPEAPSPPHSNLGLSDVVPTVKINWHPSKPHPPHQQQLSPVKSEVTSRPSCQTLAKTSPSGPMAGGGPGVVVTKKEAVNSMDGYLTGGGVGGGGAMEGLLNMEMSLARMAKKEAQSKAQYSSSSPSSLPFQLYGKLPKQGGVAAPGFSYTANVSVVDGSGFSRSIADGVLQLRQRHSASQSATLSIQAFADSAAEEVALKCSCRLKAMIMCQGCGAFCHDDCIGPSKLCVSCLVVR
ncbi:putative Polycomb group protein ASXL1 isoform X2 [Salmo trutta]|uniref:ASXL transcriptional regulator 1 n=1 Tax=Salmo trutta TaxID=8032 RepID=A0A673ZY06_SALTR|nr:putative Polycomb group protein ASXL1 isoform X2 [Salmo trutta]